MNEEPKKPRAEDDAELEREIRSRREFSVAEAIARHNSDLLKGASPVTLKRQAEFVIERYLEVRLDDTEGALRVVLRRRIRESERLLSTGYEEPLEALSGLTAGILGSEASLRRFVAAVDAEWGRIYSERPHFELPGRPADRGDPYTIASVRAALESLCSALEPER